MRRHLPLKLRESHSDAEGDVEGSRHTIRILLAAVLALAVGLQVAAVFTTNVHWDEFALLHLADLTAHSGRLEAGGRAGLAVAMLIPLVEGCESEIEVIRRARLLWVGLTFLWLAGLTLWLAHLAPRSRTRWRDAGFGVALLALTPAWLDSSLQVRTDHIALAGTAWGGALLLLSLQRPGLALAAGACFGLGFLGSQKALYGIALAGFLTAGVTLREDRLRPARETLRCVGLALGFVAAVGLFRLWAGANFDVAETSQVHRPLDAQFVAQGLSLFDFYRNTIGWSQYRSMLTDLVPHTLLAVALIAATLHALRTRNTNRGALFLACGALTLGIGVALFHAAAFRYFWLTLGVFLAAAFALGLEPILARLPAQARGTAIVGFAALLGIPAALHGAARLSDGHAVQRESLAFVHRNFSAETAGFHPESGLFCQEGAQPLPTFFSQHIYKRFAGPHRAHHTHRLLQTFRETPVAFLVQSFRLNQFPPDVRQFWHENYQPYQASVFVAGRRFSGTRGESANFELLVPGRYRWLPSGGATTLAIEERVLAPGESVTLQSGPHTARFVETVPDGLLVLALNDPPGEAPVAFYRQP